MAYLLICSEYNVKNCSFFRKIYLLYCVLRIKIPFWMPNRLTCPNIEWKPPSSVPRAGPANRRLPRCPSAVRMREARTKKSPSTEGPFLLRAYARSTFPDLRQEVHTYIFCGTPFTFTLTDFTFDFHILLVLLCE